MTWWRIDMPPDDGRSGFVCAVEVIDGVVVTAAPIMGWSGGKSLSHVQRYVMRRGGTMAKLPPYDPPRRLVGREAPW